MKMKSALIDFKEWDQGNVAKLAEELHAQNVRLINNLERCHGVLGGGSDTRIFANACDKCVRRFSDNDTVIQPELSEGHCPRRIE